MKENNKYIKISIWLNGGGKIVKEKEFDGKVIAEMRDILKNFHDSINAPTYSPKSLMIDNCVVKFSDISAIDVEEKIDPMNC